MITPKLCLTSSKLCLLSVRGSTRQATWPPTAACGTWALPFSSQGLSSQPSVGGTHAHACFQVIKRIKPLWSLVLNSLTMESLTFTPTCWCPAIEAVSSEVQRQSKIEMLMTKIYHVVAQWFSTVWLLDPLSLTDTLRPKLRNISHIDFKKRLCSLNLI